MQRVLSPNALAKTRAKAFVALALTILPSLSCQKDPAQGTSRQSAVSPSETESLPSNELIWAGIAGNPPEFIDTGIDQGLGFMELQTKPIRKALTEAGFKIRYEYFSPSRIAHEFSRKTPICFYPTDWRDPKKMFERQPDRLYSVALDFRGEETHSILIRKQNLEKFQKYLDPKGWLNLQALLLDPSFKTLFPKTDGLGPEFDGVYQTQKDGSFEISPKYRRQITSRRLHDNDQLVRMLVGGSLDYLLEQFVIQEDYKVIEGGEAQFLKLPYEAYPIRTLLDPRVILSSVSCSLSKTSEKAIPLINTVIRGLRSGEWSARTLDLRLGGEVDMIMRKFFTLTYRFSNDLASGKTDEWLPLQSKYFPGLEKAEPPVPLKPAPLIKGEPKPIQNPSRQAEWILIRDRPHSAWLLPKADAIYLANRKKPSLFIKDHWLPRLACIDNQQKAWSPTQLKRLKDLGGRGDLGGLGKSVEISVTQGLYEDLAQAINTQTVPLTSFSLLARGLTGAQLEQLLPISRLKKLETLELVSANTSSVQKILPAIPASLQELNLWGSNLGQVQMAPLLSQLKNLSKLNLSCASILPAELSKSLLSLPPALTQLRAGHQPLAWNETQAAHFGQKSLPSLQVLDLEYSALDDRHCAVFNGLSPRLTELDLSGNDLTSNCLKPLFGRKFPNLVTLQLDAMRISSKATLTLPASVQSLDLGNVLKENSLSHLQLPPKLKSLQLSNSHFAVGQVEEVVKHLHPQLEFLDLSNSTHVDTSLFKLLVEAEVKEVKDLRLNSVQLLKPSQVKAAPGFGFEALKSISVQNLELEATHLSNSSLLELATWLRPELEGINLGRNFISTPSIQVLLKNYPQLKALSLSEAVDLDLKLLAPQLPLHLRSLDLGKNWITDGDLEALVPHLSSRLMRLDLTGSYFGLRGATVLATAFGKHQLSELNELKIEAPSLSSSGWKLILSELPGNLRTLELNRALLTEEATSVVLPRHLSRLTLDLVQMTLSNVFDWIESLPLGIDAIELVRSKIEDQHRGNSSINPTIKLPDSLGHLRLYSDFSDSLFRTLIRAAPHRRSEFLIRNSNLTESTVLEMLQEYSPWIEYLQLSQVKLTHRIIQKALNLQLQGLSFANSNLAGLSFGGLTSKIPSSLKLLAITTSSVPPAQIKLLLTRLPPNMYSIYLIDYSDAGALVRLLPPGLANLNIRGTKMGPKGVDTLKAYGNRIEETTGLKPTFLVE